MHLVCPAKKYNALLWYSTVNTPKRSWGTFTAGNSMYLLCHSNCWDMFTSPKFFRSYKSIPSLLWKLHLQVNQHYKNLAWQMPCLLVQCDLQDSCNSENFRLFPSFGKQNHWSCTKVAYCLRNIPMLFLSL